MYLCLAKDVNWLKNKLRVVLQKKVKWLFCFYLIGFKNIVKNIPQIAEKYNAMA